MHVAWHDAWMPLVREVAMLRSAYIVVVALGSAGCPSMKSPVSPDAAITVTPDAPTVKPEPGADPDVYWPRTLYLMLPDRFANGDPTNDQLGAPDCFDPTAPLRFHGGDLAGLSARRGYLRELGIGVVWATPLTRQVPRRGDSCGYHGYWADLDDPADPIDDAIEPKLGTPADFTRTLDDLAADDIRFVLDVVTNHSGRGARIVTTRPDWFHSAQGCTGEIMCPLNGLPDFALERPEIASYVTTTTTAWFRRYPGIAGIRMDTAKHVPTEYFVTSWMPEARSIRADLFAVAEVFSDGDMAQFKRYFDAGFDSVFHFPLRRALVDTFAKRGSVDHVSAVVRDALQDLGLTRALFLTTFLDNHDTPRFLTEAGTTIPDAELARRYRLALVALFTLPGIPQLYYGDELGAIGAFPDNRRDMPAWAFDAATRAGARPGYAGDPGATFSLTRSLIALRRDHAALHRGSFVELWRQNGGAANVLAYFRASGSDRALAIINNGTQRATMQLPFHTNPGITPDDRTAWPDATVLHDALGIGAPATATITAGNIHIDLPPQTAGIYVVP
jgi:alpha-amylase